jgi:hypothetical protein
MRQTFSCQHISAQMGYYPRPVRGLGWQGAQAQLNSSLFVSDLFHVKAMPLSHTGNDFRLQATHDDGLQSNSYTPCDAAIAPCCCMACISTDVKTKAVLSNTCTAHYTSLRSIEIIPQTIKYLVVAPCLGLGSLIRR